MSAREGAVLLYGYGRPLFGTQFHEGTELNKYGRTFYPLQASEEQQLSAFVDGSVQSLSKSCKRMQGFGKQGTSEFQLTSIQERRRLQNASSSILAASTPSTR